MNDFLTSLAMRAVQPNGAVQPRLRSRFEPGPLVNQTASFDGEVDATPDSLRGRDLPPRVPEEKLENAKPRPFLPGAFTARLDEIEAILASRAHASPMPSPPQPVSPGERQFSIEPPDERGWLAARVSGEQPSPLMPPPATLGRDAAAPPPQRSIPSGNDPKASRPLSLEPVANTHAADKPLASPTSSIPRVRPAVVPLPPLPRETSPGLAAPAQDASPRVIQISIGRIEIRASASASPSRARAGEQAPRAMTLAEYLNRQSTGGSH
jgi:hypothetical protein